jgi:hypothetical protein
MTTETEPLEWYQLPVGEWLDLLRARAKEDFKEFEAEPWEGFRDWNSIGAWYQADVKAICLTKALDDIKVDGFENLKEIADMYTEAYEVFKLNYFEAFDE